MRDRSAVDVAVVGLGGNAELLGYGGLGETHSAALGLDVVEHFIASLKVRVSQTSKCIIFANCKLVKGF